MSENEPQTRQFEPNRPLSWLELATSYLNGCYEAYETEDVPRSTPGMRIAEIVVTKHGGHAAVICDADDGELSYVFDSEIIDGKEHYRQMPEDTQMPEPDETTINSKYKWLLVGRNVYFQTPEHKARSREERTRALKSKDKSNYRIYGLRIELRNTETAFEAMGQLFAPANQNEGKDILPCSEPEEKNLWAEVRCEWVHAHWCDPRWMGASNKPLPRYVKIAAMREGEDTIFDTFLEKNHDPRAPEDAQGTFQRGYPWPLPGSYIAVPGETQEFRLFYNKDTEHKYLEDRTSETSVWYLFTGSRTMATHVGAHLETHFPVPEDEGPQEWRWQSLVMDATRIMMGNDPVAFFVRTDREQKITDRIIVKAQTRTPAESRNDNLGVNVEPREVFLHKRLMTLQNSEPFVKLRYDSYQHSLRKHYLYLEYSPYDSLAGFLHRRAEKNRLAREARESGQKSHEEESDDGNSDEVKPDNGNSGNVTSDEGKSDNENSDKETSNEGLPDEGKPDSDPQTHLPEFFIWIIFRRLCEACCTMQHDPQLNPDPQMREAYVHIDIKPPNILLSDPPDDDYDYPAYKIPKLADFEFYYRLYHEQITAQVGTMGFLAPEQIQPDFMFPSSARGTDVFQIGIVIFGLLYGCGEVGVFLTPHTPVSETISETKSKAEPPYNQEDLYSKRLHELVESCLQEDQKKRPHIAHLMQDVRQALDTFSEDNGGLKRKRMEDLPESWRLEFREDAFSKGKKWSEEMKKRNIQAGMLHHWAPTNAETVFAGYAEGDAGVEESGG